MSELEFKVATEPAEFEAIHRLNYETFVEEIPQHPPNPERRLVDRFHAENIYFVCLREGRLVGMLALRGKRPFSLDGKLPDLDAHLPPGCVPCEVRLLAVRRDVRRAWGGLVLRGLLALFRESWASKGYTFAVISGTTRESRLYRHMGFVPFGPLVGTAEARYQPMYMTPESFEAATGRCLDRASRRNSPPPMVNLTPGPVTVRPAVSLAMARPAESHRSDAFKETILETRRSLCGLVRARHAALFMGSGTLANDVVGAQLSLLEGPGIVLSNGEFGDRLADHARRFRLDVDVLQFAWGQPFDLEAVRRRLLAAPKPAWLWFAHGETSTGVLNDLPALKRLAADAGVRLCVDAISTVGATPVDLDGVYLAASSSGKGLRSLPGVAMVFHASPVRPAEGRLPRYLDLGLASQADGVPFTFLSNLVVALREAIRGVDWPRRFQDIRNSTTLLQADLLRRGFELLSEDSPASFGVTTIAAPTGISSVQLGERMAREGYLLGYQSNYLKRRNWFQMCLFGDPQPGELVRAATALEDSCSALRGVRAPAQDDRTSSLSVVFSSDSSSSLSGPA